MAETLSLMEFLQALLVDAGLRGSFEDDPHDTLVSHGLADLSPADVHDALVLVQDNQTVDFTLDPAADTPAPPPPPASDDHEAAVEYLTRYLTDPQTDPQPSGIGDELWADVDATPSAVATPVMIDSWPPGTADGALGDGTFGTGVDGGFGTGTIADRGNGDDPDRYDAGGPSDPSDLGDPSDYEGFRSDDPGDDPSGDAAFGDDDAGGSDDPGPDVLDGA